MLLVGIVKMSAGQIINLAGIGKPDVVDLKSEGFEK